MNVSIVNTKSFAIAMTIENFMSLNNCMNENNSGVNQDQFSEMLIEVRGMNQRMEKIDEVMTALFSEMVRYRTEWEIRSHKSSAGTFCSFGITAMTFLLSFCMAALTVFQMLNTEVWNATTQWMVLGVSGIIMISSVMLLFYYARHG